MTNVAALGCVHGDIENLMKFLDKMSLMNIDILVCLGDFTDYFVPRGISRLGIGQIIIEELRSLNVPIVTVPGSWDKDLVDFLKKETISVHGEGKVVDNIGFYGYGGAKTPFNTPLEPADSEVALGLEKSYNDIKMAKIKLQVTHAPPARTKLDMIVSGAHVGSDPIRKFIEDKQPDTAVCAHIHESRGVDELGRTKIINCGRFPEGYFGLISIEKDLVTVKMSSLI